MDDQPWHICDECLDPLADELLSLARRFFVRCDFEKLDRGEWQGRMPPTPLDVESLYGKYNVREAINYLKVFVSVGFAHDFKVTLDAAQQRFVDLHHKACLICNGNDPRETTATTTHVRYAVQRLMARHEELLHETYTDRDYRPDREELPEDLRLVETEFVDEYTGVEQQFLDVGKYLKDTSALIRSKMTAKGPPVLGDGNKVQVGDAPPIVLTVRQGAVLGALIRLGGAAQTPALQSESSVDNPARYLREISDQYPELRPYIIFPGRERKGGYRTSIVDKR